MKTYIPKKYWKSFWKKRVYSAGYGGPHKEVVDLMIKLCNYDGIPRVEGFEILDTFKTHRVTFPSVQSRHVVVADYFNNEIIILK